MDKEFKEFLEERKIPYEVFTRLEEILPGLYSKHFPRIPRIPTLSYVLYRISGDRTKPITKEEAQAMLVEFYFLQIAKDQAVKFLEKIIEK